MVPSLRKAQEVSLFIARKVLEQNAQSIFNADQGAQFNSESFISLLKRKSIQVSMDGRGISHRRTSKSFSNSEYF